MSARNQGLPGGRGLRLRVPRPLPFLCFCLASSSIASLLIYFSGLMSMASAVLGLLLPSIVAIPVLLRVAARRGDGDLLARFGAGLYAGSLATLAYDLVRLPLAHAGVPVFKAISYFGTLILAEPRPTLATEVAGWTYHFSNGVGFAIMYTLLAPRPAWWSAALWGVLLEAAMLVTPYAEVFGYRLSAGFIAASLSAHLVYGLALWLGARQYVRRLHGEMSGGLRPLRALPLLSAWIAGPVAIGLVAADFHRLHATTIPASPPSYIGPDLYVTWNVPEPDRIGSVWLMRRFVDPAARFHFVEPMSRLSFGTPFDIPEAEVRRYHNRSAFEVLLDETGRRDDPALQALARFCYVTEIRPWALASEEEARLLAESFGRAVGDCRSLDRCLDAGLGWFDETYRSLSTGR